MESNGRSSIFPIGDWKTKAWGRTRQTVSSDLFTRHELHIDARGYCSLHKHEQRANRFRVLTGKILVARLDPAPYLFELTADNVFDVASAVWHMFLSVEASHVVEEYYPDRGGKVREDDIVRASEGGIAADFDELLSMPMRVLAAVLEL